MTSGSARRKARNAVAKSKPNLRVDLDLLEAGLGDLNRILGRPDLAIGLVEMSKHRVQRGGLAGSGGSHHEKNAVGMGGQLAHLGQVSLSEVHRIQRQGLARGEDAKHRALPVHGRESGHAQLDGSIPEAHHALAILGLAVLGDV